MATAIFFAVVLCLIAQVHSRLEFVARIPNGDAASRRGSGITCPHLGHNNCVPGASRNSFGLGFKAAGLQYTRAFCRKDSDGDGIPNGEELGDPCCTWRPGRAPARRTMLSHPGVKAKNDAKFAPPCRQQMVPGRVGRCRSLRDRYTASCVCNAIVTGAIRVGNKAVLSMTCRRLLGSARRIRGLGWSCRAFFASPSGQVQNSKISRNTNIVNRCK